MTDHITPRPAAVLWDFDGTLVDTEPLWFEAEGEFMRSHGGTWSDELAHELIGVPLPIGARRLVGALEEQGHASDMAPDEVVSFLVNRVSTRLSAGAIEWRPGARELLEGLRAEGVRCALVSMSFRELLQIVVDQLPEGTFDVIVAGDEVERGKPDPEPYLTAASHLGVDVTECIVVEDSPTGTAAGVASGAAVVAVENLIPLDPGGRSVVLRTLAGVNPEEFFALAGRA